GTSLFQEQEVRPGGTTIVVTMTNSNAAVAPLTTTAGSAHSRTISRRGSQLGAVANGLDRRGPVAGALYGGGGRCRVRSAGYWNVDRCSDCQWWRDRGEWLDDRRDRNTIDRALRSQLHLESTYVTNQRWRA